MNKMQFIIIILSIILLLSCDKSEKILPCKNIIVENFINNDVDMNNIIDDFSIVELRLDTSLIIGRVKDLCIVDTTIFILDDMTFSLSSFSLKDGRLLKTICRKGNGPKEYINPVSISVSENKIYLLDLATNKIIVFGKDLEPLDEVRISFTALDFIKAENGFLFYNMGGEKELGKFVYTDLKGNIQNSFIPSTKDNSDYLCGGKLFVKNDENEIYATDPLSNTIYHWDKNNLSPYIRTDFQKYNIPDEIELNGTNIFEENYAVNCNFFITSFVFINSFLYKDMRYYNFKSLLSEKSISGKVKVSNMPFYPQWQSGKRLISVCPNRYIGIQPSENSDTDIEDQGLSVILFNMKQ